MRSFFIPIGGVSIPAFSMNTLVVGTGAAGYSAALRLFGFGQADCAILTEGVNMGTSRNTGSDKQTYYKLSLSGSVPDSPQDMARDLFAGGCVDGDIALAEAALSTRCFLNLCELGVDFPVNRYGEFVGYRTDHDPRARATSVGPLTSRRMTECLEKAVMEKGIPILDGYQAIAILKDRNRAMGILALNKAGLSQETARFAIFLAKNIIYATGGPAGIYADTVYPEGHSGASGIAFEAGAYGRNLTEWQYGLASIAPRWNVSGTYMQALPRFISVDPDGTEHGFIQEAFPSEGESLSMVFRKGYEWPFDCRKTAAGSSRVDLLVYRERVILGRRVYMDFRQNPFGRETLDYSLLSPEAFAYLDGAGACFGAPIDRLIHMNEPAYELYRSKGLDLKKERLEIALCAQHMNGGLDVDMWWRTSMQGLFAVGEAAGSHGVYRPGGSALNAGQVGAFQAARYIAAHGRGEAPTVLSEEAKGVVEKHVALCRGISRGVSSLDALATASAQAMSAAGAALREPAAMEEALAEANGLFDRFESRVSIASWAELPKAYRFRDALISRRMLLTALLDYRQKGGGSRGSALYAVDEGISAPGLPEGFRFQLDDGAFAGQIQRVIYGEGGIHCQWRPVTPLPEGAGVFETVWRTYRENGNVL